MWPWASRRTRRRPALPILIAGLGIPRHPAPGEGGVGSAPAPDPALAPFFEATADPMLLYGPDFVIVRANAAAGRLLREPEALLRGRSVLESPLLSRLLAGAGVPQRLQGDTTILRDEVTVTDIEGLVMQCRLEALRLADGGVLLHIQDTSAVLRAHEALRALEELQRTAADVLPGVSWIMALPEERLTAVNPGVERLFGHQPAALLQRPGAWEELAHPGDRERVRQEFRSGVASGRPFDIHFTGVHRDRHDLPDLVIHVTPVHGGQTWAERAYGFIEDLSGREAVRRDLAEARAQLRLVLDTVPVGVLLLRLRRGRPTVAICNRCLAELLRLDEPVRSDTPLARVPAELLLLLRERAEPGQPPPRLTSELVEEYVVELGEPARVLRVHAGPLRDERGAVEGRILTTEDITTGWTMQRRLTEAQRLESLARLAGGMAHDFNNLLGTIHGFAALLQDLTPEDDARREPVRQILEAAGRAERLTGALLESSRSARFERVPLSLNRAIEDAYALLRSAVDPTVSLRLDLAPELPLLLGDARLIQQALLSLAQELRPRLGSGGTLALSTRLVSQQRPAEEARGEGETGHAIALELHVTAGAATPRAVEPMADRSGLGLSVAEDIVRAHSGWLVTGKDPGAPAFCLVFPVDTLEEAPLLVPAVATGRGHEMVLVVDDEPGLRALARTGLQQHGFDVMAVETGEQALEILKAGEPRVDAMLLDLTLPGMSGEAVLREVRRLNPRLPIIIASGYATVESQASWTEAGAVGFVAKPFRVQQVARRLREALDRRQPQAR